MEKNENEELLEQSPAEIQQEDTQKIAKSGKEEPDTEEQKVSNGRFILWSLAGVYLLYTSYSLCKGYVTGEEGTSMGFMLAGIAFAAIGAGLLFFGIKNMLSAAAALLGKFYMFRKELSKAEVEFKKIIKENLQCLKRKPMPPLSSSTR